MTDKSRLGIEGLSVSAGDQTLLHDTDVEIPAGQISVIVGASGAGKSVLLKVLAGLIPRVGGSIAWAGEIQWQDEEGANQGAPTAGVVFQSYALFDELTPTENVQFAIGHRNANQHDGSTDPAISSDKDRSASKWLDRLGVPAETPTSVLSGGQKQRLAIARTLAANPELVLYDEPTSGLDSATGKEVAELIKTTHQQFGRTSVIVTHDYETLLPIADRVLLFDATDQTLRSIDPTQHAEVQNLIKPVARDGTRHRKSASSNTLTRWINNFFLGSGQVVVALLRFPAELVPWVKGSERNGGGADSIKFPRGSWLVRFVLHYLRLVGGPSACAYLIVAGLIVGFTTTYFTFRFLPFRGYTQPLLIDELLSSIGFALYRVLVPILATVLIAARCGAAVAADVGVKRYNGTIDAMQTFGVPGRIYLLIPILIAFLVATPILQWLAFQTARSIAAVTFIHTHSDLPIVFWKQHFDRNLIDPSQVFRVGWGWVWLKVSLCGLASGAIGYYRGNAPKGSASDVSRAITSTVLWSTLTVLVIHFVVALFEF